MRIASLTADGLGVVVVDDKKVVQIVGADGASDVGARWAQQDGLKQGQEVGLQRQGGQVSHLSQVLWCWMEQIAFIHPST